MKLFTPDIFRQFPEIAAAMSLRDESAPAALSMTVPGGGADTPEVIANRQGFMKELGFEPEHLALVKQTHTDIIIEVAEGFRGRADGVEGDALITNKPGWLVGVLVADCIPLLLYDPRTLSVGVVHSGWRGSAQNITGKAVEQMTRTFGSNPADLYVWLGPGAGAENYEVGYDVAGQFNPKYSKATKEDKWLFDNTSVVYDQLVATGVLEGRIEVSTLDTITNPQLHSARRDKDKSGRMLAAIGIY